MINIILTLILGFGIGGASIIWWAVKEMEFERRLFELNEKDSKDLIESLEKSNSFWEKQANKWNNKYWDLRLGKE